MIEAGADQRDPFLPGVLLPGPLRFGPLRGKEKEEKRREGKIIEEKRENWVNGGAEKG